MAELWWGRWDLNVDLNGDMGITIGIILFLIGNGCITPGRSTSYAAAGAAFIMSILFLLFSGYYLIRWLCLMFLANQTARIVLITFVLMSVFLVLRFSLQKIRRCRAKKVILSRAEALEITAGS